MISKHGNTQDSSQISYEQKNCQVHNHEQRTAQNKCYTLSHDQRLETSCKFTGHKKSEP